MFDVLELWTLEVSEHKLRDTLWCTVTPVITKLHTHGSTLAMEWSKWSSIFSHPPETFKLFRIRLSISCKSLSLLSLRIFQSIGLLKKWCAGCALCFRVLDFVSNDTLFIALCFVVRISGAVGVSLFSTSSLTVVANQFPGKYNSEKEVSWIVICSDVISVIQFALFIF